jgi:23S rRNA (uracil1939-C5)-methyltransferase
MRDRLGFFREGTHEVCDAASTQQLSPEAVASLASLARVLSQRGVRRGEVELSENVPGSERALHLETDEASAAVALEGLACEGVTGLSSRVDGERSVERMHAGTPYVHDALMSGEVRLTWRRHLGAFFQANRHLLQSLVEAVVGSVPGGRPVVDLYAGVGLFSVALAASRAVKVVAVEGDALGAADLMVNAAANPGEIEAVQESVESFVARRPPGPVTLVVDPPRTGMSPQALQGMIRWAPPEIVYVSCDTATFARDTRTLMDAGYELRSLRAFDLFPNTPHVETLATFARA